MLNHIFLPPKLPQKDDSDLDRDIFLCQSIYTASLEFSKILPESQRQQWSIIIDMLRIFGNAGIPDKNQLTEKILGMKNGGEYTEVYDFQIDHSFFYIYIGVIVLHIRAQNAALILRRHPHVMVFEAFEVSPPPEAVMEVTGKLICSYPGPAVELPHGIAQDPSFVEQLVCFLNNMDIDRLDAEPTTTKAGSEVQESRCTAHPRYITQLLTMILRGMGNESIVNRITKRIADEVCWKDAENPWRRSPLWLVVRVAIQTTVDSLNTYKSFMIYFHVHLLRLFLVLSSNIYAR